MFKVIKYEGENDVFVWKHPAENFNTKSQLIVRESQEAVFLKNGQALDCFPAGRHTLNTQNIPILSKLINLPFGGESPFQCEVYFINKVHSLDIRWGTSNHMPIQDPVYGVIIPVGANGQFGIKVEDSRKLLIKLVGTIKQFDQDTLIQYFKGILMTNIKDYLAKQLVDKKISFLQIHAHLNDISEGISQNIAEKFEEYGIKLVNFYVNTIIVPEDDPSYRQLKGALSKRAEMGVVGYTYEQERTFDILESAAENEGTGSSLMGAGMGLGMGVNMGSFVGSAFANTMSEVSHSSSHDQKESVEGLVCSNCNAKLERDSKFCCECGQRVIPVDMSLCPSCGALTSKGKFCSECGGSLVRKCTKCQSELQGDSKFCSNCGTKV